MMVAQEMDESGADVRSARAALAVRAMEVLLRGGQPRRLDYFFPTDGLKSPHERDQAKDRVWQQALFDELTAKDAVNRFDPRRPGSGPYYAVKNRYFITTLLQETKSGGDRMYGMLMLPQEPEPPPPQAPDPPRPDDTEPQPEALPTDPAEEEPASVELAVPDAPARPRRIDAAAVYDLLEVAVQRMAVSIEYQSQMATALVFVKDEVVYIRDRQSALSKRLKTLEEKLGGPAEAPGGLHPEIRDGFLAIAEGMAGVAERVNAIRAEVAGSMAPRSGDESDKLRRLGEALSRLTGEMSALRDLAAASMGTDDE